MLRRLYCLKNNFLFVNNIWFRRKRYGWGWYPVKWQGWLVIFVFVALFASVVSFMRDDSFLKIIILILIALLLILVCYKKGEKPKWQWGEK